MVSQVKYIRIRILKSGIKDSLRIMLVKRKIRKILSKSLIPYFLNSLNKDKEILVKRSPGLSKSAATLKSGSQWVNTASG